MDFEYLAKASLGPVGSVHAWVCEGVRGGGGKGHLVHNAPCKLSLIQFSFPMHLHSCGCSEPVTIIKVAMVSVLFLLNMLP